MYPQIRFILKRFCLIFIIVFLCCDKNEAPTSPQFNNLEEEINYIAEQYVKVGAMIGVINKEQEKLIFSYGTKSYNRDDPPDANSVFEIGSITKTFTTTILADMFLRGDFTDDTVSHYLPADQVTMPSKDGIEIEISADTICVHGDNPAAVTLIERSREALLTSGIEITPFGTFL